MRQLALWLWLLCGPALAGRTAPPTASAAPAGPPPPTMASVTAPNPFASYAPSPPLRGSTNTLDFSTLQRASLVYELHPPALGIAALTAADLPPLRQTLAADPRWRVSGSPGALVATERVEQNGVWRCGPDGWQDSGGAVWRASLRLYRLAADHPWATSPLVARVKDGATTIPMQPAVLQDAPWVGKRATAFTIDGAGVAFDMFEARPNDDRTATEQALIQASELLQMVEVTEDYVLRDGTRGMLLPPSEPGAATLRVTSPAAGRLELQARANPGAEGWTWLRLITAGRAWEEAGVAAGTREVIGFSATPTEGWWMQSVFPVPTGASFEATAELWFLPLSGTGTPRRIATQAITVPSH
jgi:hypothetical protein